MKNKVNNVPDYAYDYPAWVCSEVDNELWFYGAYETGAEACRVAMELGMRVIED